MTSKLSLSEERQRRRIATELHDSISQDLALSVLKLSTLRKSTAFDGSGAQLAGVIELLEKVIQDTRNLTFDLSSPTLYKYGFEQAIEEWLTRRVQKQHGIKVEFSTDGHPKLLDEDVGVLLFQATRELLINIIKHAQAKTVKVSVKKTGDNIETVVEDDGVGFDASEPEVFIQQSNGFGLFNIQERLRYIGGDVNIESKRGVGTRVTLAAPLTEKQVER